MIYNPCLAPKEQFQENSFSSLIGKAFRQRAKFGTFIKAALILFVNFFLVKKTI